MIKKSCLVLVSLTCLGSAGYGDSPGAFEPEIFEGEIRNSIQASTPDFQETVKALAKLPNVVVILADDLGYSDIGSYGSDIQTPNLDKLADSGIRFSHFTATAVCSSTRAALLTGLNHHSTGTGWLAEWDFGFPGYRGEISVNVMTLPEILRQEGFATFMVGKWHLTNSRNRSRIGPFDSWPTGRGFERFWGFLDGEASQFKPHTLINGTEYLDLDYPDDFYLPDQLTDKAIGMIDDLRSHDPDKPFFLYYATGAPHAPHHTKAEDRKKYLDQFAVGWDEVRNNRLENMQNMGLVPDSTVLTGNIPGVEPWDKLSSQQQRMYARLQENYAAFVDNMDQNIGRLVDHLQAIGERDNTIIIFTSDNGGSREVGVEGASNSLRYFHKRPSTNEQNLKDFNIIGDIETHPHYPLGWMQASNTPFTHSKRTAHDGGTRVPLIISWPAHIQKTGIRHQFHHVNDLAPTLMEALDITLPPEYKGNTIKPMEGTSMRYTFNDPGVPGVKSEQYYEMEGRRAYYKDGLKIISYREPGQDIGDTSWELYNLANDFSAATNIAALHPEKVAELDTAWWDAAEKFNVLPIIDVPLLERPMYTRLWNNDGGRTYFEYRPGINTVQRFNGPVLANQSYTVSADIDLESADQEGVLVALGDVYSGYSLFIKDRKLYFEVDIAYKTIQLVSNIPVPLGDSTVAYRFDKINLALAVAKGLITEGLDFDRLSVLRGRGSLWINGKKVAEAPMEYPVFAVWEGLDIGRDTLTPVSDEYESPYTFTGELKKLSYQFH